MSEEKQKITLYDITNISIISEKEQYKVRDADGKVIDMSGDKYTLVRNGTKLSCPYKGQDWKRDTLGLEPNEVSHKPTCNSHCPLFSLSAALDDVDKNGMAFAQVKLMCGSAPVFHKLYIKPDIQNPEPTLKKV